MTLLRLLLAWFGLSAVLAPVVGRALAAGAETTTHTCGGTLLFVREADGHSYEQCETCGWYYGFGDGQSAADVRTAIDRQCRKPSA